MDNYSTYSNHKDQGLALGIIQDAMKKLKQCPYDPIQRYYVGQYEWDYLEEKCGVDNVVPKNACEFLAGLQIIKLHKSSFCAKEVKPERLSMDGWRCDIVYWDELDMIYQSLVKRERDKQNV